MPSHKIESEMADMHVSLARWSQRKAMEGCLYKGSYHAGFEAGSAALCGGVCSCWRRVNKAASFP